MRILIFQTVFVALLHLVVCFDPDTQRVIDMIVQRSFMTPNNITGAGLAIVKDNGKAGLISKGYGFKDLEKNLSADGDTKFPIGSISKSFTAILAVKTLSEKFPTMKDDTALDTPIKTLVPSFDFMLNDRFRTESTTLRDLLSHKTGTTPADIGLLLVGAYKDKDEYLYRHRYAKEIYPFRTKYSYNNGGPIIASAIIAAIANRTFEDMLTELFRDIGMSDTTYIRDTDEYDKSPNFTKGYYVFKGEKKEYNRNLLKRISFGVASGGIVSTPNDMIKYMMFHLNNGKVGDQQIVPEASMEYLRTCSNAMPIVAGKENADDLFQTSVAYGLGVVVGFLDGWETTFHNGYITPFYSHMTLFPALKLGIFSASNGPGLILAQNLRLHQQIYSIIQKGLNYEEAEGVGKTSKTQSNPTSPTPSPTEEDEKKIKIVNRMPKDDELVGLYGNALFGEFNVTKPNGTSNGNLYLSYGKYGTGTLIRQTNTTFLIQWDSDLLEDYNVAQVGNTVEEIDFSTANTSIIWKQTFTKDLTLDKLPKQPWDANSCAPTNIQAEHKIKEL